jgi:hypothetical protein
MRSFIKSLFKLLTHSARYVASNRIASRGIIHFGKKTSVLPAMGEVVDSAPTFRGKFIFAAAACLIAAMGPNLRANATTAAPVFSPASGGYHTTLTVKITDATAGAIIYYTTDGSRPTTSSSRYYSPLMVGANESFHALAIANGSTSADVVGWYTIALPAPVPVASVAGGTYNKIQYVTLTDGAPNATIYYTLDTTYPSTSSPKYTGPIEATTNTTITAWATAPNYEPGSALRVSYTIVAPPPVITPNGGVFQDTVSVRMSDAVVGALVHWTNDGSIPTAASGGYYNPIIVDPSQTRTEVFRAMATAPGYLPSSVTYSEFIVDQTAGTLATAKVGTTPLLTIPPNFMGISTNYDQPPIMMGQESKGVNQQYRTLLRYLTANATAPLLIRIPADDTKLSDVEADVEPLAELAEAVNVNYTLGVDLWKSTPSLAQSEASAWISGVPNSLIYGIEIGNEPDVYPFNGARPSSYSWSDFLAQFHQWQSAVDTTTGNAVHIMGPSMGSDWWVPEAGPALADDTLTPHVVSEHAYLGKTAQESGAAWPQDYLLYPGSATEMPTLYTAYAAAAHKAGRIFRMDEINSFYNGGVNGISTTFSSSLWSIDTMFNYVKDGFDGVNWITAQGTYYQLFQFHSTVNNGMNVYSLTQVAPLYYGLLVFSQMAGNNAKLLPVTTSTSANVSIWATVDDTTTAHVVVINKDENATGKVQITLPGYTSAKLRYLSAAVYWAANGVTLGGQTFDGSTDGTIQGSLVEQTITGTNGVFVLPNMPITCAAVLDLTK